ncbi:hypothetical protein FGIG_07865 [Fasciola gigantica]|uniref:Uncharacterized protein n=1 Tax=Fasciola gigantica TaxID=46835 RepID=A0A504YH78_FASGI|nr:hypothetical protein FGIG_07865 [Fasciola gigantica]
MGPISGRNRHQANIDFFSESDPIIKRLEALWGLDCGEPKPLGKTHSAENKRELTTLDSHTCLTDGHLEVPLPWREKCPSSPNNEIAACNRLYALKGRFSQNTEFKERFTKVLSEYVADGHADAGTSTATVAPGWSWYLPHNSVINPMEPEKLRVKFDCAS